MKNLLIAFCLALFTFTANANLPENSLYIPVGHDKNVSIVKESFDKTIDKLEKIYKPIIKDNYKVTLYVERNWTDGTVNAYASQSGTTWKVAMFGGLARHPIVTPDGFAAVVCHELGHHIGGQVKMPRSWATAEGQADYYATSKCLKLMFEDEDEQNIAVLDNLTDSAEDKMIADKCEKVFGPGRDQAICVRSTKAGEVLASLLNDLGGSTTPVKVTTPDLSVVSTTYMMHPDAQCRLDAYFAGALCDKDPHELASMTDVSVGSCTRKAGYTLGVSPLCWYKPSEFEK